MKRLCLVLAVMITSCSSAPSETDIQTAIAKTAAAAPAVLPVTIKELVEVTRIVTPTQGATATFAPTITAVPIIDVQQRRKELVAAVVAEIEKNPDVKVVTLARFNNSDLEVELKTRWASQSSQPDVSFSITQTLSKSFAQFNKAGLESSVGGPFSIRLTTYSTDGNYRYQSKTDFDTMVKLGGKSISYLEWVAVAGAGFK